MDTEALGRNRVGRFFMRIMAAVMESRWRYKFFAPLKTLEGADLREGTKVLEIGCGTGFFTPTAARMVGEAGSLTSMDMSPLAVEMVARKVKEAGLKNVQVVQGNALDTGLGAASLDEVFIFGVIPAPMLPLDRLLAEMHRILKPGGIMAVWPPSWVQRSIRKSPLFEFVARRNGVFLYRRE